MIYHYYLFNYLVYLSVATPFMSLGKSILILCMQPCKYHFTKDNDILLLLIQLVTYWWSSSCPIATMVHGKQQQQHPLQVSG